MEVRSLDDADGPWVADLCRRHFGTDTVVVPGRLPGIPRQGVDGIPVRHLLELERTVGSGGGMP